MTNHELGRMLLAQKEQPVYIGHNFMGTNVYSADEYQAARLRFGFQEQELLPEHLFVVDGGEGEDVTMIAWIDEWCG